LKWKAKGKRKCKARAGTDEAAGGSKQPSTTEMLRKSERNRGASKK